MENMITILESCRFIVRSDFNLLEALESQNIDIEYQCREGFCGSCQIQLVDGEVEYFFEPIAFIPKGRILPCCCRAKSNLTIAILGSTRITSKLLVPNKKYL